MTIYDAHIHFYFSIPAERLKPIFHRLAKIGLTGFSALVFPEFPADRDTLLKMVPGRFHDRISVQVLEKQQDPFPYFAWAKPLTIVPFVDARFIVAEIAEKMARFRQQGYRGLKVMYVPEEDITMDIRGMEETFRRSVRKSEEITGRLVESAASQGMCILFHADLRRYGDFVVEMIRSYPATKFNIPHFGFSRKAISRLLEELPNCYTDTSALAPFMEEDPAAYRDFVREYQDKILFGSDALIGDPEDVKSPLRCIERLLDDEEIFHKLVHRNYLLLHGPSGP